MTDPYGGDARVILSGTYDGYHYVLANNGHCPVAYVQFPHEGNPEDGLKAYLESGEILDLCELFVPAGNRPGMIAQYAYVGTMFPEKEGEGIDQMMSKIKKIIALIKEKPAKNPFFI